MKVGMPCTSRASAPTWMVFQSAAAPLLALMKAQSRLWENVVGRSRGFCEYFYPRIQETFPSQLGKVPVDAFYRAVNKVEPSLIRTDADEVTYKPARHVAFDFEMALAGG